MGFLECASSASAWRGYDYYKKGNVLSIEQLAENIFSAKIAGNSSEPYSVELQMDHPRKSTCTCPHAAGRSIVCKHMIATYFTLCPLAAEEYYKNIELPKSEYDPYDDEYDEYDEDEYDNMYEEHIITRLQQYIKSMTQEELQHELFRLLLSGSDRQFNRFIAEHEL